MTKANVDYVIGDLAGIISSAIADTTSVVSDSNGTSNGIIDAAAEAENSSCNVPNVSNIVSIVSNVADVTKQSFRRNVNNCPIKLYKCHKSNEFLQCLTGINSDNAK